MWSITSAIGAHTYNLSKFEKLTTAKAGVSVKNSLDYIVRVKHTTFHAGEVPIFCESVPYFLVYLVPKPLEYLRNTLQNNSLKIDKMNKLVSLTNMYMK